MPRRQATRTRAPSRRIQCVRQTAPGGRLGVALNKPAPMLSPFDRRGTRTSQAKARAKAKKPRRPKLVVLTDGRSRRPAHVDRPAAARCTGPVWWLSLGVG